MKRWDWNNFAQTILMFNLNYLKNEKSIDYNGRARQYGGKRNGA